MVAWLVTWDRDEGRMSWGKSITVWWLREGGQGPGVPFKDMLPPPLAPILPVGYIYSAMEE